MNVFMTGKSDPPPHPYSRGFVVSPVSRHFQYSRDFHVSPVHRHFWKKSWKVRRSKYWNVLRFKGWKAVKLGRVAKKIIHF